MHVNGCFSLAKNKEESNSFYKLLNEHHNSIKFTIKHEQNNGCNTLVNWRKNKIFGLSILLFQ